MQTLAEIIFEKYYMKTSASVYLIFVNYSNKLLASDPNKKAM